MKPLRTERLVLRQWEERDRPLFHYINSDDRVMRFFPVRRNRSQSDAMMDRFSEAIAQHGFGFAAVELAESREVIGFAGITHVDFSHPLVPPKSVEIGWRLAPEHWGKGYASEAARKWLDYGFETARLSEIFSLAVWNNNASTAVMRRIGMEKIEGGDFDYTAVPESHPHLRHHVLYRMDHAHWLAQKP